MRVCNNRVLTVIVFSFFFAWLLAFPFEGQVLYAIAEKYNLDPHSIIFSVIIAHVVGLFSSGLWIKNIKRSRQVIIFSIVLCIITSIMFLCEPSVIWNISLGLCSFFAATSIGAWGHYLKSYTPKGERIKTVADGLIYSNIIMILINMSAIHISPNVGIGMCILTLISAFLFAIKLPYEENSSARPISERSLINSTKPLSFLCLFITVITINSGLMYQAINPAFEHLEWLVSWYWAVPYIIAIIIMRSLPKSTNRTYILFIAIAMIGLAFVAFMGLDNSPQSYFIVNTLMLGACGVFDLFWWSILGEMLDLDKNPTRILGIGLSANVLGVLVGGVVGSRLTVSGAQTSDTAVLALTIVFISLILLPPLNKYLSKILKNHAYLEGTTEYKDETMENDILNNELSVRENEIAKLLLKGRTYKMIASELYLSENTIKTHIKNIYSKMDVKNKTELVNMLGKKN